MSCDSKEKTGTIEEKFYGTQQDNTKLSMLLSNKKLENVPLDSIPIVLTFHLEGNETSILGNYIFTSKEVIFEPLVPLTRGKKYEARINGELIMLTEIEPLKDPAVVTVTFYPSVDTLPENLLKFYIAFSQPMQEGYALENIVLIRNEKDTLKDVFMDIQPELWDRERKILTLWLDPGRIKRDLQPNQRMGNPLEAGNHYRLMILPTWQDATGRPLQHSFTKEFITGPRDVSEPLYKGWNLVAPKARTRNPLKVTMKESLDYGVLTRAIHIHTANGDILDGTIEPKEKETMFYFTPDKEWTKGEYTIELQARLEDLAGNNLERPFDRNLHAPDPIRSNDSYRLRFTVR